MKRRREVDKSRWWPIDPLVFLFGLPLMWLGLGIGPLTIVFVPVCIYFLLRRRFIVLAIYALLLPFPIFFAMGVVDYSRGTARLKFHGLPMTTFYNLDRELRCSRTTSGCMVSGGEWAYQKPYNSAIRLMTSLFGLMPGAYDGPYPTEQQAFAALDSANPVRLEPILQDRVLIDDKEVGLDEDVGWHLIRQTGWFFAEDERHRLEIVKKAWGKRQPVTATIWKGRCLILRIPMGILYSDDQDTANLGALIVLIDCEAGRPFAYYGQGDYYHSFPPVSWRKGR